MSLVLTTKELAALKGCTIQSVQKAIQVGNITGKLNTTSKNRPQYLIPIDTLEPHLQKKYYQLHGLDLPPALRGKKDKPAPKPPKPLDAYTADQREQIGMWLTILQDWQAYRCQCKDKERADEEYIAKCCQERPGVAISRDILYRKQRAYRSNDYDGLIDKRGLHRKGNSDCPEEIKTLFFSIYLSEEGAKSTTSKCYECTKIELKKQAPELLPMLPSLDTVYRWVKDFSAPIKCMAREGKKAFYNRFDIVVHRMYEGMLSNDYWVADGHTMDVITTPEKGSGKTHRLTISGIIDVYSGAYVGWTLTDNPCTSSTLYALRKAIVRNGLMVPKNFYVDNGLEYLNKDVGGTGHRTKKSQKKNLLPTPVFQRLGIQMVNALPANGKAKTIEREWMNLTATSRLCSTYCGSNPTLRPENLQEMIDSGKIPTDGELIDIVDTMIDGYYNQQPYNGPVVANRGKTKWQVYLDNLPKEARKVESEEVLNLLLMRSERLQTVTNLGVHINVHGTKIWYFNDDLLLNLTGKKVFVRYDPENIDDVRVYDQEEKYVMTVPMRDDMRLKYGDTQEKIQHAMREKRRYRKAVKEKIKIIQEASESRFGHINMLDTFMEDAREARAKILFPVAPESATIIKLPEPSTERQLAAAGDDRGVVIDIEKMIKNREKLLERG